MQMMYAPVRGRSWGNSFEVLTLKVDKIYIYIELGVRRASN